MGDFEFFLPDSRVSDDTLGARCLPSFFSSGISSGGVDTSHVPPSLFNFFQSDGDGVDADDYQLGMCMDTYENASDNISGYRCSPTKGGAAVEEQALDEPWLLAYKEGVQKKGRGEDDEQISEGKGWGDKDDEEEDEEEEWEQNDDDEDEVFDGGREVKSSGGAESQRNGPGRKSLNLESRRELRLERNRLSARLSRLRKKDYTSLLEGRVSAFSNFLHQKWGEHAASMSQILNAQRKRLLASVEHLACKANPTLAEDAALIGKRLHIHNVIMPCSSVCQRHFNFFFPQPNNFFMPPPICRCGGAAARPIRP